MLEILVERQPALLIPLLSIVGAALVCLVWIVAHYWASARRLEVDANLKRDMLNRGLGAADIERVLLASSSSSPEERPAAKDPITDNEYYLVEKMLDEEYPVEEIERLVRAFKSGESTNIRLPDKLLAR
jgi:hypothetical protein